MTPTNAPAGKPDERRKSRRFQSGPLVEQLVPVVLVLLVLGLAAAIVITVLSVLGLTPAF